MALQVTEVKPEWLLGIAPHIYKNEDIADCKWTMQFMPSKLLKSCSFWLSCLSFWLRSWVQEASGGRLVSS
jgi:hypothetical protein